VKLDLLKKLGNKERMSQLTYRKGRKKGIKKTEGQCDVFKFKNKMPDEMQLGPPLQLAEAAPDILGRYIKQVFDQ
jgi:hypothetical protein